MPPTPTRGRRPQPQQQPRQAPAQDGPSRALVAVTREIDNRLAIVRASGTVGIRPDRLKLVALSAFSRTPALWSCEPVSVARAIVEAGQLGLEPTGLLGGAYLVPRGGKATLLIGYRGLVILALRSGEVQRVEARVVRERDQFEYAYGLEPRLYHVPSQEGDPGKYTGAYAVLFYRDGSKQFDYMSIAEIEAIRKRSSSPNDGPWVTDYAEMCKKTPLRRLMKLAPLTIEDQRRLEELDPEAPQAEEVPITRQAELRHELQEALTREYGTAPAEPAVDAEFREVPTTEGSGGAGTSTAAGAPEPEAAPVAASGDGAATTAAAAGVSAPSAAATGEQRPPSQPERVSTTLGVECGATDERLGAGPCVLPRGHDAGAWRDPAGNEYAARREHMEAGGTQFTLPQRGGPQ